MGPDPDLNDPTPGMHIWGWMSPAELTWLGAQAASMRSVVEIGCLHGRSSFALATACPGTVYCIDPWSDDGYASWTRSIGDRFPNVVGIREPSPAAGARVPDPVDMVFIDGAHDHASVAADIAYWKDRAQVLLCGHDYPATADLAPGDSRGFPDVKTVVDELLGEGLDAGAGGPVSIAPGTAIWTWLPRR